MAFTTCKSKITCFFKIKIEFLIINSLFFFVKVLIDHLSHLEEFLIDNLLSIVFNVEIISPDYRNKLKSFINNKNDEVE